MSLDNRPKTVVVTFADGHYQQHEEALRQYLMFNGMEAAILRKHPDREDTALIAFEQRYEGENFMAAAVYEGPLVASNLPSQLGKVELAWYKADDNAAATAGAVAANGTHDEVIIKVQEGEPHAAPVEHQQTTKEDRDMDTYDDVD